MSVFAESKVVALLAAIAVAVVADPVLSAPTRNLRAPRVESTADPVPGPDTAAPDERLRSIIALIDQTRARAAAPGLRDEERDALAELAWAQVDEALEDPLLRERAHRDPDFLQAQALLLLDDGEDEEALGTLERLLTIAAENPETHRLLALCFIGLGRAPEAIEEFRRALAIGGPAAADVRSHLAYALAVSGRGEEGLRESERAIAAAPTFYLGHFIRGWILGDLGRGEEERREYLNAVQLERDDADLWALLAESWERAGDPARAREAWREVVRIEPSDEEAVAKSVLPGPPSRP